jgi:hypothetical protein
MGGLAPSKLEARNPKCETNSKMKIQMTKMGGLQKIAKRRAFHRIRFDH